MLEETQEDLWVEEKSEIQNEAGARNKAVIVVVYEEWEFDIE